MNPAEPESVWRPTTRLALLALACGMAMLLAGWYGLTRSVGRPSLHERGAVAVYSVDLNTADRVTLEQLPRLGSKLADAIVTHRERQGAFTSVEDLLAVKGVGPSHLAVWREYLTVGPSVNGDRSPSAHSANPAPVASVVLNPTLKQASGGQVKPILNKQASADYKHSKLVGPPHLVDVNTASLAELQTLPGIGPVLSERITLARSERPFTKADDLRRVPGIGPKTLEKIRPYLRFGPRSSDVVQD